MDDSPSQVCLPTQLDPPTPKRRRVRVKIPIDQLPPGVLFLPPAIPDDDAEEEEEVNAAQADDAEETQDALWWEGKDDKQKYVFCFTKLRRYFPKFQAKHATVRKRRINWPETWTKLNDHFRTRLIADYVEEHQNKVLACVLDWMTDTGVKVAASSGGKGKARNPKQLLLTYNSESFLLPDDPERAVFDDADVCAVEVSKLEFAVTLWQELTKELAQVVDATKALYYAMSLEVSPTSIKGDGPIRLHVHLALLANMPLRYKSNDNLKLCGAVPVPSFRLCGRSVRSRTDCACLYYVSCPKYGGVFKTANHFPHHDYSVNPMWVWNWLSLSKLSVPMARQEIVRQGKDLCRHLPNLDRLHQVRDAARIQVMIANRNVQLQTKLRPWKPNQAVASWFAELSKIEGRRKFLVLSGDSRVGKSDYAMSLTPEGTSLRLKCQNVLYPPMRGYSDLEHKVIVFDECSVACVLENRLMFQAPNAQVQIGMSPTGRDVFSVYLHNTRLIVTSNGWVEQMKKLEKDNEVDHRWIRDNSVHVHSVAPLYEDAEEPTSTPTPSSESP